MAGSICSDWSVTVETIDKIQTGMIVQTGVTVETDTEEMVDKVETGVAVETGVIVETVETGVE